MSPMEHEWAVSRQPYDSKLVLQNASLQRGMELHLEQKLMKLLSKETCPLWNILKRTLPPSRKIIVIAFFKFNNS